MVEISQNWARIALKLPVFVILAGLETWVDSVELKVCGIILPFCSAR